MSQPCSGWRIYPDPVTRGSKTGQTYVAVFSTAEGVDVLCVQGFSSELLASQFIALYLAFVIAFGQDSATKLLQQFVGAGKPS